MRIRPYYRIFAARISMQMSFRFDFVFGLFVRLAKLLIVLIVWNAIFAQQGKPVSIYNFQEMMIYLILANFVNMAFHPEHMFQTEPLVRKGLLSFIILRPYSFTGEMLARFLAGRAVNLAMLVPFFLVFLFFLNGESSLQMNSGVFILLVCSLCLTFVFGMVVGMLAFWLVELWPLRSIYTGLMSILGGTLYPLDLLPDFVRDVALYSPFAFFSYVNVKSVQGALSMEEIFAYVQLSLVWILLLSVSYGFLRSRGLKRYEAVNA